MGWMGCGLGTPGCGTRGAGVQWVSWRGREALRRVGPPRSTPFIGKGAFEPVEAVMTVVGRVVGLWRYPVKSMAGEELDGVEVSWHGLAGDRRRAFIREGKGRRGFPGGENRAAPERARYRPGFAEPDRPDAPPTLGRTPSGGELDVACPELAAELGPGVRVIRQNRGGV